MVVSLVDDPFSNPDWLFEPKLDGFRILAYIRDSAVRLVSRNGNDFTERYPAVAAELEDVDADTAVLDGEIVALNDRGLPDFGLLQRSSGIQLGSPDDRSDDPATIMYYAFDILYLDGRSLLQVPLIDRKGLLAQTVTDGDSVKLWSMSRPKGSPSSRPRSGPG